MHTHMHIYVLIVMIKISDYVYMKVHLRMCVRVCVDACPCVYRFWNQITLAIQCFISKQNFCILLMLLIAMLLQTCDLELFSVIKSIT